MLKKLLHASLYATFLGLLIGGAAYRTSVVLASSNPERNQGITANDLSTYNSINPQEVKQETQHSHDRTTLTGLVADVSNQYLSIKLPDGQLLEITRSAWRYAQEIGFTVHNGDSLLLEGFYEDKVFKVTRLINPNDSRSILLRDENGHPLWSGR